MVAGEKFMRLLFFTSLLLLIEVNLCEPLKKFRRISDFDGPHAPAWGPEPWTLCVQPQERSCGVPTRERGHDQTFWLVSYISISPILRNQPTTSPCGSRS
ncbi:hypothetical protein OF001_U10497 [Pseudomonas sp. OF001]|nr:hypothetical protein OF001_U10497 [Pseudomonas sp. OF001]